MGVHVVEHAEIIHEWFHEHSKIIFKNCIHHSLISWWNILEPKWHDYLNESSPIGDECNLIPIFNGDHDPVIIGKSIKKRIDLVTNYFV